MIETTLFVTEKQAIERMGCGRLCWHLFLMHRNFPRPVEEAGKKYFWPALEDWLQAKYGVPRMVATTTAVVEIDTGPKGDFEEYERKRRKRRGEPARIENLSERRQHSAPAIPSSSASKKDSGTK